MESYVYVIGAIDINDGSPDQIECLKIGVSGTPEARLANLQTGNHRKLRLLYSLGLRNSAESYRFEKELHETLAEFRTSGEWFTCQNNNVFKFVKKVFSSRIGSRGHNWQSASFYEEAES